MSRRSKSHPLIDHAAVQAGALVDQATEQASALVEQMTPHLEAARERVVTEYVPQARKAGRRARKQLVEEYVPAARAALEDARGAAEQAVSAAAEKTGRAPAPKRRGRRFVKVLAVIGVGALVATKLRNRDVSPVSMYEAPSPAPSPAPSSVPPPQAVAPVDVDPVPPGAIGEHDPSPEDLARLEDEAPPPSNEPPGDSLNSFFDDVMNDTAKGSRGR